MSIVAENVGKTLGDPPLHILSNVSLNISNGEFVAITGRSGSGKSTLLYLLSSLDLVTEGSVQIDGRDIRRMSPQELSRFRNEEVGFVFQFHYLLQELNALENVLMPARKSAREAERLAYAEKLLNDFGLSERKTHLPRQLSGGELQRLAIARALLMEPRYLFADEPTGSLDSYNGELVMNIISRINRELKTTVVMVTHDIDFARRADRQIHMVDGKIQLPV